MAIQPGMIYGGGLTPVDPLAAPGRIGFQRIEPRDRRALRVGPSFAATRGFSRLSTVRGTQKPGELARLRASYAPENRATFRAGSSRLLQSWMGRRVDLYA